MKQIPSLPLREARKFIVIFYVIGVMGFLVPFTQPFFVTLIPYSLLLTVVLLAMFHTQNWMGKHLAIFGLVYLCGLMVEMAGVNSGLIFGNYIYGDGLGFKIAGTPLIIGLNWLFLVYTSSAIVGRLKTNTALKIMLGALLLVGYDLALEQVAPKLKMWYWEGGIIPLQNYLAWFVIGLLFHMLFQVSCINTRNPLAVVVFVSQVAFFILLSIILP